MANIKEIVPFILKWEGGYVNDPIDRGGATNKGITFGTFCNYREKCGKQKPKLQELKDISEDEWTAILKYLYWDRWKADRIENQSVANILVDWVWGSGVHGIKIPQRILNVTVDGIVGEKTLIALNSRNQKELFDEIWQARKIFFEGIVNRSVLAYEAKIGRKATAGELTKNTQRRFLKGWMNRLNDYRFYGESTTPSKTIEYINTAPVA